MCSFSFFKASPSSQGSEEEEEEDGEEDEDERSSGGMETSGPRSCASGGTRFRRFDSQTVDSIANRLISFPSDDKHTGTDSSKC